MNTMRPLVLMLAILFLVCGVCMTWQESNSISNPPADGVQSAVQADLTCGPLCAGVQLATVSGSSWTEINGDYYLSGSQNGRACYEKVVDEITYSVMWTGVENGWVVLDVTNFTFAGALLDDLNQSGPAGTYTGQNGFSGFTVGLWHWSKSGRTSAGPGHSKL